MNQTGPVCVIKAKIWVPERKVSASDISEMSGVSERHLARSLGMRHIRIADKELSSTDMALKSLEGFLSADLVQDVSLLIWTGSEVKDYFMWSASVRIQYELGLANAFTFDLFNQSCSDLAALRVAKGYLCSEKPSNLGLLTGGHKINSLVDYQDSETSFLFNFSDGASSVLVGRGERNPILGCASVTDGSFSFAITTDQQGFEGGIRSKFRASNRDELRRGLTLKSIRNYITVIERAIEQSNPSIGSCIHLACNQMSSRVRDRIVQGVRFTLKPITNLEDYGHTGSVDPWLCVQFGEIEGRFREGDLICLVSAGLGYTWNAVVIRWDDSIFERP